MIFEGRAVFEAPAERVWEALLDVDTLAACLPGVQQIRRIDDDTFEGAMLASVGPISGRFDLRVQIGERTPPSAMQAAMTGTDSVTKSALRADMDLRLEELAPRQTAMAYRAAVQVKGRLAILGDMMLRATATVVVEEFLKRLRQHVEAPRRAGA